MSDDALPLRRVLITGAHGLVGRHVAALLDAEGVELVCPHRPGSVPPEGAPGRQVERDLEREPIDDLLEDVDAVVHLAAQAGGIQLQEHSQAELYYANQAITRSVLASLARAAVRRVFLASSAVVYRDLDLDLIPETAPVVSPASDRVTAYAWSKLTDELAASWYAAAGVLDPVIGRFTNVYGPGAPLDPERSMVVHSLVRKALEAGPDRRVEVWGDGTAVRSFLYVEDVARAVVVLLRRGRSGGVYNVDSSEPVTIAQLAEVVRDAVDPELVLEFDPSKPQGPRRRVLDSSALRALGFTPQVSLVDGVRATVRAAAAALGRA